MATLKANGSAISEMVLSRVIDKTEDSYTEKETYFRAMSSGHILRKVKMRHYVDGMLFDTYEGTWKRHRKIKKELVGHNDKIKNAMSAWSEQLNQLGHDTEITF